MLHVAHPFSRVLCSHVLALVFSPVHRSYMELLPLEIASQLPFRFFKVGGTSEAFLDQVRATEGNVQVSPILWYQWRRC